ncbi:MAG: RtcB family protein [Clostridiaceae bacterium]|nr:RtcB family protein [Clostridiaceae bacterium]
MIEIKGKYNTAKVFTNNIEKEAAVQIEELCDQAFVKDSTIRVMPDMHAGKGCTIGTTMTVGNKIVPNLVGVDIGCGLELVKIKEKTINLQRLDEAIYKLIPSGFHIKKNIHPYASHVDFDSLKCKSQVDINRGKLSIGTLGGGNHFIEVNKDEEENLYIVVHSGSRNLGNQVATLYQQKAYKQLMNKGIKDINKNLAYLEGDSFKDYLHDMHILQQYAVYNRKAILDEVLNHMGVMVEEKITTIHNYIDLKDMILRKGAISAKKGEKVIIPMNMRDGSLICVGKGNPDWNYSAPHGAGRLMSRTKAKEIISLSEFEASMKGIYSTSIKKSTIDEAAMAYKPMEEIIENTRDTVDILHTIKPIYNFKA